MISFVTLSRDAGKVRNLEASVRLALDSSIAWEIVVVDGTRHDLFTGYNAGAQRARGETLAFVHDDVMLLGNSLTVKRPLELLQDAATGFLGVAGSRAVPADGCWWRSAIGSTRGMAAHRGENEFGTHYNIWPWVDEQGQPTRGAQFGRVAVLDGVLLMCRKATLLGLGGFDDKSYRGFHFYDVDITFRAAIAGLRNYAAPLPLMHFSQNDTGEGWEAARQVFLGKYAHLLPWSLA